jgi:hypothetical protein
MSSLWDAVFIQVLDRTGPLMLHLSGTPYIYAGINNWRRWNLLWWCGGAEHSDGRKGEGMIKKFDFIIGSE